jgi:DNA polymerase
MEPATRPWYARGVSDEERAELVAEVRAHLEWEAAWSGFPMPEIAIEPARFVAPGEVVERRAVPTSPGLSRAPVDAVVHAIAREEIAPGDRVGRLRVLASEAANCQRCRLHSGRTRSVFARGSANAQLMFVGEGPGYHEDQQGEPFVGAAGQLLDKMIGAMGLSGDSVYICNVVKCRPPENRTPLPDEAGACSPFLRQQIEVVAPKVIVALGRCAAENLGCAEAGRSWRGAWGTFAGLPVMPTYHPAYLLRTPEMKKPVWEDLQKVMQRLGLPPR